MDEYEQLRALEKVMDGVRELVDGLVAEVRPKLEVVTDENWRSFVSGHPELAPEPATFTDEDVVAAIDEAIRQETEFHARLPNWRNRKPDNATGAYSVAQVLCGRKRIGKDGGGRRPTASEIARVNAALLRLEKAGRVIAFRPRDRRASIYWCRAERADSVGRRVRDACATTREEEQK